MSRIIYVQGKISKKNFKPPKCIYNESFIVYTDSMYLKLTNAAPAHQGTPIAIRKDLVVSMHQSTIVRDDGTVETVTFVHAPPHGTWECRDTFESVLEQLAE